MSVLLLIICSACCLLMSQATTVAAAILPWNQLDYDALASRRVPFPTQHNDYVQSLGLATDNNYGFHGKTFVFHSALNKFLIAYYKRVSVPNRTFLYFTNIYMIDPVSGKVEQTPFKIEDQRYEIEQNALVSSMGNLYIEVYDVKLKANVLLKINTNTWSYSAYPMNGYSAIPSVLVESNNCYLYMNDRNLVCADLDNPISTKWNLTLPQESFAYSKLIVATENNQQVIYASLYTTMLRITIGGRIVTSVPFGGRNTIMTMVHTGVDSLLAFTLEGIGNSSFGMIDMKSGNYKTTEHFALGGSGLDTTVTFIDHSIGHSYMFKSVVISSEAHSQEKGLHVYTTMVHLGEEASILKPFSLTSINLKTSFEIPCVSITKDNSKVVIFKRINADGNGEYCLVDIRGGSIENCKSSAVKGSPVADFFLGADNGKVYNIVGWNKASLESLSLMK